MALPGFRERLGREQLRGAVRSYFEEPGARAFRAVGFTPNAITLLGFAVCVVSAYLSPRAGCSGAEWSFSPEASSTCSTGRWPA